MTSKPYLVSWLGNGRIIWTPLKNEAAGYVLDPSITGPARAGLDLLAKHSEHTKIVQSLLDPAMSKIGNLQNMVQLTTNLGMLTVGLQLAQMIQIQILTVKLNRIEKKINLINGKFDLHFLDRSIEYFENQIEGEIGVPACLADALREDGYRALDQMMKTSDLEIPAYLRIKLTMIAKSFEAWTEFLYAVLHGGAVPRMDGEGIKKMITEKHWPIKDLPTGHYVTQGQILEAWSHHILTQDQGPTRWWESILPKGKSDQPLIEGALVPKHFDRCRPLIQLVREIETAQALMDGIEQKIVNSTEKALLICPPKTEAAKTGFFSNLLKVS